MRERYNNKNADFRLSIDLNQFLNHLNDEPEETEQDIVIGVDRKPKLHSPFNSDLKEKHNNRASKSEQVFKKHRSVQDDIEF